MIFTESQREFLESVSESESKRDFVRRVHAKHYTRMPAFDPHEYPKIPGMEGPFQFKNGEVLYYDPKEKGGRYYDRKTDMYKPRSFMPESVEMDEDFEQTMAKAERMAADFEKLRRPHWSFVADGSTYVDGTYTPHTKHGWITRKDGIQVPAGGEFATVYFNTYDLVNKGSTQAEIKYVAGQDYEGDYGTKTKYIRLRSEKDFPRMLKAAENFYKKNVPWK